MKKMSAILVLLLNSSSVFAAEEICGNVISVQSQANNNFVFSLLSKDKSGGFIARTMVGPAKSAPSALPLLLFSYKEKTKVCINYDFENFQVSLGQ